MTRALIFDLDDTLYRERRFALSGYAEVAQFVERAHGVPACEGFRILRDALVSGCRAAAFQRLGHRAGAGSAFVDECRDVYRQHAPRLRLPLAARAALASAGQSWRVAILTNGLPTVQRAKVAALGVASLVDAVIYAHEVGAGKPDPAVFLAVCATLGVEPRRAVMAGDDPWCDVDGARSAGLLSIRVRQGWYRDVESGASGPADRTVHSIADVPEAASTLIHEGSGHAD